MMGRTNQHSLVFYWVRVQVCGQRFTAVAYCHCELPQPCCFSTVVGPLTIRRTL